MNEKELFMNSLTGQLNERAETDSLHLKTLKMKCQIKNK